MSKVSRQAAIGAVVAAFLALGASASPESGNLIDQGGMPHSEANIGVLEKIAVANEPIASVAIRICASSRQSAAREGEPNAVLTTAFQACGDKALAAALDAFAEIGARLK